MHIDSLLSLGQQENSKQIAALHDDASEGHIAEHIRGMVAATMAHLSSTSDTTRNDAAQWQQWALGVADKLVLPVAGYRNTQPLNRRQSGFSALPALTLLQARPRRAGVDNGSSFTP